MSNRFADSHTSHTSGHQPHASFAAPGQSPGADVAVTVRDLHVKRGKTLVFDGIDVDIHQGQITGMLGPSGCGKTTLMRSIVGVQKISGGTVRVLGETAGSRSLRHRVAYDTQASSVYSDLTVRQNLSYFARLVGASRDEVSRVIARVGLDAQASQSVASLSGGQANRVSLGIALLGGPEVLVLDEPTVGLDPILRNELWDLFRDIAAEGTTILVSSHVMDEALRCDRLLLMREGRIIADTTPAGLLESTGADDPDAAFLALIDGADIDHTASATTHHGRHAKESDQ
ncbi:ABC transporter ATP-binding protein [Gulosibacter molinativorax]|uniref:ABC transporter ATP-binding protein n=1 Tax=Gulosibacter molinativorax TaxID=256821 RepID=A0ABT7CDL4_9MICO|nr:ABC transporter ATP-binding protein [Gulosibacter molinativorax]MDJ1372734.1 ABC transporter ATP-binding protein [Gulosibacter molinativorax]QUY62841.1 Putative ABC transporter ATP-binding protein YbhF [Gulosibacter molinativorax]